MPSEDLIARLRKKDKNVLPLLYERYAAPLYGIVLRLMKDRESADACLHEVFMHIWKNGLSYDPGKTRFFTWMTMIARNTAIHMIHNKSFREHSQIQQLENVVHIATRQPIRQNPETMELKGMVSQLDSKHTEILRLVYFEGFNKHEASQELAISLDTAKSSIKKAMGKLRSLCEVSMEGIATVVMLLFTVQA
jgi:RNA polymerase sigma-70 factor (ECF subfamily)